MVLYLKHSTLTAIWSGILYVILQSPLLAQETNTSGDCADDNFNQKDVTCFDLDGDGFINQEEYLAIVKHRDNELYRLLDKDRDGRLFDKEQEDREQENELIKKIRAEVERIEADEEKFETEFNNLAVTEEPRDKLSIKEAIEIAIGPTPKAPLPNLLGFQIREEYEDIRAFDEANNNFARFNGASISFTSDFANDNDIFLAKGAIFRPIKISSDKAPSSNNFVLTSAVINPGVSFDRVDNSNSDDEDVDVLEFRLGSELEFSGGGLFDIQYLRVGLIYQTDFDFNRGIFGGELQWEPLKLGTGIGAAYKLGPISFRWRPILHLEGGEDYFRIGPKISLEVWPEEGPLERFTLSADYEFYQTIINDSETRDLFDIGLTFRLDEGGNTTIDMGYRTGEVSLDAKDVDEFSLGFGVKF
ncbi:MAG: hypothetical protein QNJ60_09270 [Xenococcaceae cyanobacterium MO_188.B19]|nr:hypothetical protein [Xenococcaceae cyanobacterium MO_188.B19]